MYIRMHVYMYIYTFIHTCVCVRVHVGVVVGVVVRVSDRVWVCVRMCMYIQICKKKLITVYWYIQPIWPKSGPFRGVFWVIRFSTFENAFSWKPKKLTQSTLRISDVRLVQNFTKHPPSASEVSGENSCEILSLKVWNKPHLAPVPVGSFFGLLLWHLNCQFPQSDDPVLRVSFATFRGKVTHEIGIRLRLNHPLNAIGCILIPNLNRCCISLGLFCHVPLKRDQGDWDWRLRLDDTLNAIGCILIPNLALLIVLVLCLFIYTFNYTYSHCIHIHRSINGIMIVNVALWLVLVLYLFIYTSTIYTDTVFIYIDRWMESWFQMSHCD